MGYRHNNCVCTKLFLYYLIPKESSNPNTMTFVSSQISSFIASLCKFYFTADHNYFLDFNYNLFLSTDSLVNFTRQLPSKYSLMNTAKNSGNWIRTANPYPHKIFYFSKQNFCLKHDFQNTIWHKTNSKQLLKHNIIKLNFSFRRESFFNLKPTIPIDIKVCKIREHYSHFQNGRKKLISTSSLFLLENVLRSQFLRTFLTKELLSILNNNSDIYIYFFLHLYR